MALPIIDESVSIQDAHHNMKKYLLEESGINLIFKIEAVRENIKTLGMPRRSYLEYGLKLYE